MILIDALLLSIFRPQPNQLAEKNCGVLNRNGDLYSGRQMPDPLGSLTISSDENRENTLHVNKRSMVNKEKRARDRARTATFRPQPNQLAEKNSTVPYNKRCKFDFHDCIFAFSIDSQLTFPVFRKRKRGGGRTCP